MNKLLKMPLIIVICIVGCIGLFTPRVYAQCQTSPGILTVASSVCSGDTISLFSTVPDGTWTSSNSGIAKVEINKLIAVAPGEITVTYSIVKANCETQSDTKTVTVKPTPNAGDIGENVLACKDEEKIFTTDGDIGGVWMTSDETIASIDDESIGKIKADSKGEATISYTVELNGCHDTTSILFTVDETPTGLAIVGTNTICLNASKTLTVNLPGKTNVVWTSTNSADVPIDQNGEVTGSVLNATTQITYEAIYGACGTFTSPTFNITVMPIANAGVISSVLPGNKICSGNSTGLSISGNDAGGTWSSEDSIVATVNQTSGYVTTYNVPKNRTVKIMYTVFLGECPSTSEIVLNVDASPQTGVLTGPSVLEVDGKGLFFSSGPAGGNGMWSSANEAIATINSFTGLVTAKSVGTVNIKYTVTSVTNCGTTFAELPLSVIVATPDTPKIPSVTPPPLGLEDISISDLSVFPNPTSDRVMIRYELLQADQVNIKIVDLNGKVVDNRYVTAIDGLNTEMLDVANCDSGVYTVIIQTANASVRTKLIKQ